MTHTISREALQNAYTYQEFRNLVKELYDQGRPTSGEDMDMPLLEFTKVNMKRMDRLEKTLEVKEEVKQALDALPSKIYWVVLAEGWCGDVAQNLPVIHQMAESSDNVTLKILLRDENLDVMDQYLTNGGRSIPKLICLDAQTLTELGTWGPRPKPLQDFVLKKKEEKPPEQPKKEWVEEIHEYMHKWYAEDNGQSLQDEFLGLIEDWQKTTAKL